MASAANGQNSTARAGQVLSHEELLRRLEKRSDGDEIRSGAADKVIQRFIDRGGALSSKVVNQYNKPRSPYRSDREAFNQRMLADSPYAAQPGSDIAGLRGLRLGKGDVYMGSTAIETPATSANNHQSGHTSTPGRTDHARTILPKWMVKGAAGSAANPASDTSVDSSTPAGPGPDLVAAREAYDRANSFAGSGVRLPDLSKTGGELYNEIQAGGQSQIDDYESRFVGKLLANANLTAQEIGYAGQQAIAALPDNLKIPDYDKVFPGQATNKKGIYKWLEKRVLDA